MADKREKATQQVLGHVAQALEALDEFSRHGVNDNGVLALPRVQGATLKVAREELAKAVAVMDRTKWGQGRE